MHTYTHPFIPIHTYNNTQQIMLLLNMVLQICNFLLKTYLMEMALVPLFFNKYAKKIKDSESSDTYLTPVYPKVVPYYSVLLRNLHLESGDFRHECRQQKLII